MSVRRGSWVLVAASLHCYAPPEPQVLRDEPPKPAASPVSPQLADPAQKLRLEISLATPAVIEVGEQVTVHAAIRNISAEPQAIVLPGDGSSSGMREPHISYFGELDRGDGRRAPLGPPEGLLGCGNYDETWHDEIVTIAPGHAQPLVGWIGTPSESLAMLRPGRVSLAMRYAYTAGRGAPGFDAGAMGTTPAFELQSNNVEITVQQSLALAIRPRDPPLVDPARATRFDQLYRLEVRNTTQEPRELPAFGYVTLRVNPHNAAAEHYSHERSFGRAARKQRKQPLTIPPGATVELPELAAFDFPWKPAWAQQEARRATIYIHADGWPAALVDMTAFNPPSGP